jgi:Flp pilus assembly pilin Flp
MIRGLWDRLKQLERDETGAQGLEILLIVAAVVLPLLGLLIIFRNEIRDWVVGIWEKARGEAESNEDDFFGNL